MAGMACCSPPQFARAAAALGLAVAALGIARSESAAETVNSIGMKLLRVEAGAFRMGASETPLPDALAVQAYRRFGDFDEKPAHRVRISKPFYIGAYEVTNAQYEQFDPSHHDLRGKLGYSRGDGEAVVFVSWHDAVRFTQWLSKQDGKPYRLPTEAEWEYAARAGTQSPFWTGDTLPAAFQKNARQTWFPDPTRSKPEADAVDLTVGKTPPSPWGLFDMHGNVEEWCFDWYGPYEAGEQQDPAGRSDGDFKVTRGGSHSTELYFLRSANRSGTVPEDKSWLIGFRVVQAAGPAGKALPVPGPPAAQRRVAVGPPAGRGPDPDKPYFKGPRQYVKIAPDSWGPLFSKHNHDPAIVEVANGDLLAIWYTCVTEQGRELGTAASRLRYGSEEWEAASPFWDAPDRNDHAPALWSDGKTLYHFQGLAAAATWGNLALILRTSSDDGATWTKARLIAPEHGTRHQPVESVFRTREAFLVLPADAVSGGAGGTALHVSRDGGKTWEDAGGTIAGIHAGVAQLSDGRLMALGRGDNIDGRMPQSLSSDIGRTWTRSARPFPPIGGGQRLVLTRLREGPLLLASFAREMTVTDESGMERKVSGLFGALSFDDGETWPARRLIGDDGPGHQVESTDGQPFTMSWSSAEPRGYLSVCQSQDGIIHLIGSRQHYAFNLAWLKELPPALR